MKHLEELRGTKEKVTGKVIEHAIEFPASGTFGAVNSAESYLQELGYAVGSMCGGEPIGFAKDVDYIAKWRNISNAERQTLDGVLEANKSFREGSVRIIFFNAPSY